MVKKSKHSFYLSDDLYDNFTTLAADQNVPLGRMFEMLYDQYIHDELLRERTKNQTAVQLKSLRKQIDLLSDQSEMLIQMANTLGIKFNFQQLINTNMSESGMVHEAQQFVHAKRQSQIVQNQMKQQNILNN